MLDAVKKMETRDRTLNGRSAIYTKQANEKRSIPVPVVLQAILNLAFMCIVILALLGAIDYMRDSVKIFLKALRNYRERNGRK